MVRQTAEESVLGAGTEITGRVSGEGSLRLEGSLRGEIVMGGDAEIGAQGSLEGSLQAAAVDIAGSVIGDVHARGPIWIRSGALVRGELHADEITIEPGARVSVRLEGDLQLDLGLPKRR